jgi:hypothetical protein
MSTNIFKIDITLLLYLWYNIIMKNLVWLVIGVGLTTAISVMASTTTLVPQQSSNEIVWTSKIVNPGNLLVLQGSVPSSVMVSYRGHNLPLNQKKTFQVTVPNASSSVISFTLSNQTGNIRKESYSLQTE